MQLIFGAKWLKQNVIVPVLNVFVLISHMMSIIFIDAKCEKIKLYAEKKLLLTFFYSVYYMYSVKFILVIFSICTLHVINNRGIPLQSFNLQIADALLWGKHLMTFYSCCILHEVFETRNAHYHWIICKKIYLYL